MTYRFLVLCLLLAVSHVYSGQSVFSQSGVQSAHLSPDGRHLALLKRISSFDELFVVTTDDARVVIRTERRSPERFYSVDWLDNDRLVLQVGIDEKYERDVHMAGQIRVLSILDNASGEDAMLVSELVEEQALVGKTLALIDSLPALEGVLLVEDVDAAALWRIDVDGQSASAIEYPPIGGAAIVVSPNMDYMVAIDPSSRKATHVMTSPDRASSTWNELNTDILPVAITNSGIAHGYSRNPDGVTGVVSVDLNSNTARSLFFDDLHDVDEILFDSSLKPFAARFQAGYPSWHYLADSNVLANLHKSLRVALPSNDVAFVSVASNGSKVVAEVSSDNRPATYFLVDSATAGAQRLLESDRGLWILGGENQTDYVLQPFTYRSRSGLDVFAFAGTPDNPNIGSRPTIVILKEDPGSSGWVWGFDREVWYFNRQGFNILLINHAGTVGYVDAYESAGTDAAMLDVEDAVKWAVQNNLSDTDSICFLGRGKGAILALRLGLKSDLASCAISIGGDFQGSILEMDLNPIRETDDRKRHVLFIQGADDDGNLKLLARLRPTLDAAGIIDDLLIVANESGMISQDISEARVFAKVSYFLKDVIGSDDVTLALPLTLEQAVSITDAINNWNRRIDDPFRSASILVERRWAEERDKEIRQFLSDEQWEVFEEYLREFNQSDDYLTWRDQARPFIPDSKARGPRKGGS